ncbi:hypothetical protein Rsub_09067 [Raphidocelis subcapitata]|uniref:Uncharacterized protein n=1 Tax=Raphidocelis subcapitata TaxID=307507 RepID=A0A2V0PBF8_9CHLO|nr:hypothetical protein Rsub_09067 [Raphidocelis subcapitata]|eukprot:GBF96272.1 hypothetical protein Rsub_09067 [Raphidocelis subcapitata]
MRQRTTTPGAIEHHFLRDFQRPAQYSTFRPGLQQPRRPASARGAAPRPHPASPSGGRGSGHDAGPEAAGGPDASVVRAAAAAYGTFRRRRAPKGLGAGSGTQRGAAAGEGAGGGEAWRSARVRAYAVPLARHGYGEGGRRAPHQDYRWYKYFGFAGRGAATAWAANPSKQHTRRLGS